jgi:hypothetical protein
VAVSLSQSGLLSGTNLRTAKGTKRMARRSRAGRTGAKGGPYILGPNTSVKGGGTGGVKGAGKVGKRVGAVRGTKRASTGRVKGLLKGPVRIGRGGSATA